MPQSQLASSGLTSRLSSVFSGLSCPRSSPTPYRLWTGGGPNSFPNPRPKYPFVLLCHGLPGPDQGHSAPLWRVGPSVFVRAGVCWSASPKKRFTGALRRKSWTRLRLSSECGPCQSEFWRCRRPTWWAGFWTWSHRQIGRAVSSGLTLGGSHWRPLVLSLRWFC